MADLKVRQTDEAVIFTAKIVPGSSRTEVSGTFDGMIKIKVSAPAEKGKANDALLKFLAASLGLKKKQLTIISGHTNQVKQIRLIGISKETMLRKLLGTKGSIR